MQRQVIPFQSDKQDSIPNRTDRIRCRGNFPNSPRVKKSLQFKGSSVIEKLYTRSSFTASDLPSFRRQETVFLILNISFLALLMTLHVIFAQY